MVRLHALRLARCEHAQQHIARAGTGWQAHLSHSLRVYEHNAAAPALVRASCLQSAIRSTTLLQARRLATPLTHPSIGARATELDSYILRSAEDVGIQVCSQDSDGRTSERDRNTNLRQNASFSQI